MKPTIVRSAEPGRVVTLRPADRVKRILDNTCNYELSSWEKYEFLPNIARYTELTDKQEFVLQEIEERVL